MNTHVLHYDELADADSEWEQMGLGGRPTASAYAQYQETANYTIKLLGLRGDETILDCGCGPGAWGKWLRSQYPGCRVIGFDLSHKQLKLAQQATPDSVMQCDLRRLSLQDNSVDRVLCHGVLQLLDREHMIGPPPHWVAFAELLRVVRPGGRMVFGRIPNLTWRSTVLAAVRKHNENCSDLAQGARDTKRGEKAVYYDPRELADYWTQRGQTGHIHHDSRMIWFMLTVDVNKRPI